MAKNIILSYPRSGNHLVRFFIELLSEIPTFGCKSNPKDIPIFKNQFSEKIPFNISKFNLNDCYFKYHKPPKDIFCNKLIFIVRNPREVLLRHNNYKLNFARKYPYQTYYKNIDYYNNFSGKKILLYYEDIITDKINFINKLYEFLEINNEKKKNYILLNIDKLYNLSKNG